MQNMLDKCNPFPYDEIRRFAASPKEIKENLNFYQS